MRCLLLLAILVVLANANTTNNPSSSPPTSGPPSSDASDSNGPSSGPSPSPAPGPSPSPSPTSGNTYCDWAQALLDALGGAPTTRNSNSFVAMLGWMQGEGSPCNNNPLDTTQDGTSSSDCNSVGVKNFPTMADGVKTTIACLENGYYPDIISDLQNDASPLTTANDIANSPWGTHDAVSATQYCISNFDACCNTVVPG